MSWFRVFPEKQKKIQFRFRIISISEIWQIFDIFWCSLTDLMTAFLVCFMKLMIFSWQIYDWIMTELWQIYDRFMTELWHINDIFMTYLWQNHDRFKTSNDGFSWLNDCKMSIPWQIYDSFMTDLSDTVMIDLWQFWQIDDNFMTNWWQFNDWFMTISRQIWRFYDNSMKVLDNFDSYKTLTVLGKNILFFEVFLIWKNYLIIRIGAG